MHGWFLMTRTLMKTFFRKGKGDGSRFAGMIVLAALGALLSAGVAVMFAFLGPAFAAVGIVPEVTALLLDAGFIVVLVFGTIGIFSYVYFARDSEFLLSLPVRPSAVFLAKLAAVYAQEIMIAALVMVPGTLALGISTVQPATYYIMILLALLLVPVMALLVASLVSVPLAAAASFFRRKGAVSGILLIILFAAFMGVYMYFVYSMSYGTGGDQSVEEILAEMQSGMVTMASVLYPVYALARFGTLTPALVGSVAGSALIDLAIFFGTVIAAGALTVLISGKAYKGAALRQNEHTSSVTSAREYVSSSALGALMKKEWREMVRNTSFAFQCLAGVVLSPVIVVVVSLASGMQNFTLVPLPSAEIMAWGTSLLMIVMMGVGMNQFATTAVSREGRSFAYSKTIPVPYTTQLLAKIIVADIIAYITVTLSLVAAIVTAAIGGYADPLAIVLSAVFLLVYTAAYVNFGVLHDLKKPKLDWVTPREAVKSNATTVVPMLLDFLIGILGVVLVCVLTIVFDANFGLPAAGTGIAFGALIILSAAALVWSVSYIRKNADKYYNRLSI